MGCRHRAHRSKSGKNALSQALKAALADTPAVILRPAHNQGIELVDEGCLSERSTLRHDRMERSMVPLDCLRAGCNDRLKP